MIYSISASRSCFLWDTSIQWVLAPEQRKRHKEIAHLFSVFDPVLWRTLCAGCKVQQRVRPCTIVGQLIYSHVVRIDSDTAALQPWSELQSHRACMVGRASFDIEARGWERDPQESASGQTTRADVQLRENTLLDRLLAGCFEHGKETLVMEIPWTFC